ncbi:hypothetical protein KI387_036084 [Taxus chinensis]|uniref:NAC domain-containing protein n=1 Tax=Taxus chinensis TaxID=29808 RepID=A0AA38FSZ1_TAXCH|nr:hypothetical protein KI387_036084 [Taxus chinensis]
MNMENKGNGEFDLPGFRFHPTEEELVSFYLKKNLEGQRFSFEIIGTLDLYKYDPWQLPGLAHIRGEREWFFFVPREKNCMAPRRSRLTVSGYWKATGSDKPVRNRLFQRIGLKKTLVFYRGKAPRGEKTDWIMNEYRMPDSHFSIQKDVTLCRIYRKAASQKTLEQRAMGEREDKSPPQRCQVSLKNCECELMDELGLACVNDEDLLDCMNAFMEDKLMKPGELQVPMMSAVDKLFSPLTDNTSWTHSIVLSTPKGDGNNISPCKLETLNM